MPTKKSQQEFIQELSLKSPSIIAIGPYINNHTKVKCECLICGNQWFSTPGHLLSGKGCPVCARKNNADKKRYSKHEFANKVRLIQPNIEIVGEYINSQTKIEVHCKKCDNRWLVVPSSILHGTGCPKCNKRYRRNTEDFIDELKKINPYITVLGDYKNAHTKIHVKCNRCGTEWFSEPNGLLKGNDCSFCSHSQTSVVEQILFKAFCLLVGSDNVINRDKSTIGKELDILITKPSLAIEFGAWYWHSKRIQNDYEKECLCDLLGIRLITIYEGCPAGTTVDRLKNSICYSHIVSSEKDFRTIKKFIGSLCDEYQLDFSILEENWDEILRQAKEASRKKDEILFAQELSGLNPNIEYIGGYSGSRNQVYVRCRSCDTKWYASSAYDLLSGHGCPKCAIIKRSASNRMHSEVFKTRVFNINPDIEILSDYKGPNNVILCRCKKCDTQWDARPSSILYKKRNCPNCSPVTKKTNEKFVEELSKKYDSIIALEEYKNNRSKINFKCKACGFEWFSRPNDILRGIGCPKCANRIRLSSDEFISRVKNKKVEITSKYIDMKTKVSCRCKTCGYEWLGLPSNLLQGAGCQKCAGTLRFTNEEFKTRLSKINPTITPMDEYVNQSTKILCKCESCGNIWNASPSNLLNKHGCPKCKANKARERRSKKVVCIETGITYDSIQSAKKETGITSIGDCVNHRTKTAGGFHWVLKDNLNEIE